MKFSHCLVILFGLNLTTLSAQERTSRKEQLLTANIAGASYRGSLALSFQQNWRFGKKNQYGVGVGSRFTGFLGANQYYRTAPASLTTEDTGPLVIFKPDVEANIDTLLIKSPQVNMLNLMINLDYRISKKILAGFNIDLIGFSLGSSTMGNYMSDYTGRITQGSPTSFNLLLISDNDLGSLNSEFYVRYFLNEKWSFNLVAQFLFTEYTTDIKVQQFPRENDRFRNKSLLGAVGITYQLK